MSTTNIQSALGAVSPNVMPMGNQTVSTKDTEESAIEATSPNEVPKTLDNSGPFDADFVRVDLAAGAHFTREDGTRVEVIEGGVQWIIPEGYGTVREYIKAQPWVPQEEKEKWAAEKAAAIEQTNRDLERDYEHYRDIKAGKHAQASPSSADADFTTYAKLLDIKDVEEYKAMYWDYVQHDRETHGAELRLGGITLSRDELNQAHEIVRNATAPIKWCVQNGLMQNWHEMTIFSSALAATKRDLEQSGLRKEVVDMVSRSQTMYWESRFQYEADHTYNPHTSETRQHATGYCYCIQNWDIHDPNSFAADTYHKMQSFDFGNAQTLKRDVDSFRHWYGSMLQKALPPGYSADYDISIGDRILRAFGFLDTDR